MEQEAGTNMAASPKDVAMQIIQHYITAIASGLDEHWEDPSAFGFLMIAYWYQS